MKNNTKTLKLEMDEVLNLFDEHIKRIEVDSSYTDACNQLYLQGLVDINSRKDGIDILITDKGELFKSNGGFAEQIRQAELDEKAKKWSIITSVVSIIISIAALFISIFIK